MLLLLPHLPAGRFQDCLTRPGSDIAARSRVAVFAPVSVGMQVWMRDTHRIIETRPKSSVASDRSQEAW
eukprot:COSAG06_NODE_50134_length_320_cov_2.755656_1_plen_68_part_01